MADHREVKIAEEIAHVAADFFAHESNRESLITITRAMIAPNLKQVTIFFTVLPETQEQKALAFAKRLRSDFRIYLHRHSRIGMLPIVDFEIDLGEKNRQRIDDLTRK